MLLDRLFHLLAPPLCAGCGASAGAAEPLCARCRAELRWLGPEPVRLGAGGADRPGFADPAPPGFASPDPPDFAGPPRAGLLAWAPLAYEGPARGVVRA